MTGRGGGLGDLINQERGELARRAQEVVTRPAAPAPDAASVVRHIDTLSAANQAAAAVTPLEVPASRRPKDARGKLAASRLSARNEPRSWEPYSARLPAGLAGRLARRAAEDKIATGDRTLAVSHYLNAALTLIPADPRAAAGWGVAWRRRQETVTRPAQKASGSLLRSDVARRMHDLTAMLPVLDDPRPAMWEIQAEAVTRFLDALDAEPAGGE